MPDWIINANEFHEEHQEWSWKTGNYSRFRRHLSVELGNTEETTHPFDVELTRLSPSAKPCPVHSHTKRSEFFICVSGTGRVHRNGEVVDVNPGDCFMQPGGTRHRIFNASDTEDLVYYVIAMKWAKIPSNDMRSDTQDASENKRPVQ
jgi:mannose-6-phosphate isomerase-like protein (cupin superfamily)